MYLLQFFEYKHLPPHLAAVSKRFHDIAWEMNGALPGNPEKTTALRKLLEAKDCAVRAIIFKDDNHPISKAAAIDSQGNAVSKSSLGAAQKAADLHRDEEANQ